MHTGRISGGILAAMLMAACTGCGSSDGKFMLEGTATWNGAPIEKGTIELQPADGQGQVDGEQIVNGKFKVRTNAGPKKIAILAEKQIGLREATERIPHPEPIMHQYLPLKFNDRTELTATVKTGEPLKLDLTGEEIPPAKVSPADAARMKAQGGSAAK